MTVFRFQTRKGEGAYVAQIDYPHYYAGNNQPQPYEDTKLARKWERLDIIRGFIFGFENIKQVNKWFTFKEQTKLASFGIFLYKIEIKKEYVLKGSAQIVFRRDKILSCKQVNISYNNK